MKGMFAILGILLAAYAAPLFGINVIPLELDETYVLPFEPDAWDLTVTEDHGWVWVCFQAGDSNSNLIAWSSADSSLSGSSVINGVPIEQCAIFRPSPDTIRIGLSAYDSYWEDTFIGQIDIGPELSQLPVLWHAWEAHRCQFNPGANTDCWYYCTLLAPIPPEPSTNQALHWYMKEGESGTDIIGQNWIGWSSEYLYVLNQPLGWSYPSNRFDCGYARDVYYHDGEEYIATTAHGTSSGSGGYFYESWSANLCTYQNDNLDYLVNAPGPAADVTCTRNESLDGFVLVAALSSSTKAWRTNPNQVLWQIPVRYADIVTTDIVLSDEEEVLGFYASSRAFDIINVTAGNIWGETTPLDSGFAEMKVVGRYNDEYRRLVMRYGSELRIYRFGDPIITDADDARPELPQELLLSAYPNPFNPTTMLAFDLPKTSPANLSIFDLNGRLVSTLFDEQMSAGHHEVGFDGATLPSGIYFARLSAGEFLETQKLVLLK